MNRQYVLAKPDLLMVNQRYTTTNIGVPDWRQVFGLICRSWC